MAPRIVPGPASHRLAAMISRYLDDEPVSCTIDRFPDGEVRPELATVRGDDVYVVQSNGPPVQRPAGRHLHRPHWHLPAAHRAVQAPTGPVHRARHPRPKQIIELATTSR